MLRVPLLCVGILGAWLLLIQPVQAQHKFKAIHGASDAAYQAWITAITKEGYHPVSVTGYGQGGAPLFAAIAVQDGTSAPPWVARHGLTSQAYQQEFEKWGGMGYRLLSVSGYADGNALHFAGIWIKDGGAPQGWISHHQETPQQYQATFDAVTKKGFRPVYLASYPVGTSYAMASIYIADGKHDWVARHGLTADQYQAEFDLWTKKGYRPITLTACTAGNTQRFAVVFLLDQSTPWSARHNMTSAEYQNEFNRLGGLGYQPGQVVGYPVQGEIRYAAFFTKVSVLAALGPLPMSGHTVPELTAFDDTMQKFMQERHIISGTLAVMKDGKLVLSRGYGWRDTAKGKTLGPETPMRMASIGKPITLAAILQLIRQGKLSLTTKPFVLLGTQPPPGKTMDKQLLDITIKDLTEHKGGWDRDKAGDPMFKSLEIAQALGKTGPASSEDIITYMAGQPLQFTPGSKSVYSNFGYCVLGRVIEKVSGKKYVQYIREEVLAPINIKSITLGHSLPAGRNPDEPVYLDPGLTRNVLQPKSKTQVPWPDGGFYLEAMDSHGGLISSAPDLVHFLQAYWMDGTPRKAGQSGTYRYFFGSLPGTWTVILQRADGVNIAALFNQRSDPSGLPYEAISDVLNATTVSIKHWPGTK